MSTQHNTNNVLLRQQLSSKLHSILNAQHIKPISHELCDDIAEAAINLYDELSVVNRNAYNKKLMALAFNETLLKTALAVITVNFVGPENELLRVRLNEPKYQLIQNKEQRLTQKLFDMLNNVFAENTGEATPLLHNCIHLAQVSVDTYNYAGEITTRDEDRIKLEIATSIDSEHINTVFGIIHETLYAPLRPQTADTNIINEQDNAQSDLQEQQVDEDEEYNSIPAEYAASDEVAPSDDLDTDAEPLDTFELYDTILDAAEELAEDPESVDKEYEYLSLCNDQDVQDNLEIILDSINEDLDPADEQPRQPYNDGLHKDDVTQQGAIKAKSPRSRVFEILSRARDRKVPRENELTKTLIASLSGDNQADADSLRPKCTEVARSIISFYKEYRTQELKGNRGTSIKSKIVELVGKILRAVPTIKLPDGLKKIIRVIQSQFKGKGNIAFRQSFGGAQTAQNSGSKSWNSNLAPKDILHQVGQQLRYPETSRQDANKTSALEALGHLLLSVERTVRKNKPSYSAHSLSKSALGQHEITISPETQQQIAKQAIQLVQDFVNESTSNDKIAKFYKDLEEVFVCNIPGLPRPNFAKYTETTSTIMNADMDISRLDKALYCTTKICGKMRCPVAVRRVNTLISLQNQRKLAQFEWLIATTLRKRARTNKQSLSHQERLRISRSLDSNLSTQHLH